MTVLVNILVAAAPYLLQLLEALPGFEKTIVQFKADITGSPTLTSAQKAAALGQAKLDVDAADDEVQGVDVSPPKPTV